MTIVVIFFAAIVMFIAPLMTMADKTDDAVNLTVQTATTEFKNKAITAGKLTQKDYDNFILTLAATGNAYNVEITINVYDGNNKKKSSEGTQVIGDGTRITMYTSQVMDQLAKNGEINMPLDSEFIVVVKNANQTIAVQLRNKLYKVTGNDSSTITAEASGIVTKTAN